MKDFLKKIGSFLGEDGLEAIIGIALAAFNILIIMLGWRWFMVPVFGMASLTFGQAAGLFILATAITMNGDSK